MTLAHDDADSRLIPVQCGQRQVPAGHYADRVCVAILYRVCTEPQIAASRLMRI